MGVVSALRVLVRGVVVGAAVRGIGGAIAETIAAGPEWARRAAQPITPLGALFRGVVAGAAGSLAQDLFFRLTARIAPESPEGVFTPPEEQQREEASTATVARRFVEGLAQRGPLRDKERGGRIVHYVFGAAWGGLYGLIRGTWPEARKPSGVAAFSTLVWVVGDNLVLPAFRLAAWPLAYPLRNHAYAWVAHLAYGAAVAATFEAQLRSTWAAVAGIAGARWVTRRLPAPVRPAATRALLAARAARAKGLGRAAARVAVTGAMARAA